MKIVADTATLFPPARGSEMGMTIIPVCVCINNKTYKDYEEISSKEFLELIAAGGKPTSSQPALGDLLEVMDSSDEEMLVLTVGDGLSGAYQTALGARNCAENRERIHVVDSRTLAGPLRYLAQKAVALKDKGMTIGEIKAQLLESIDTSLSFVVPADFEFLKRSGRLTPITAKVGGVLKLLPVLTQTEDKKRIKPVTVKRSWHAAFAAILEQMARAGVDPSWHVTVCHAGTPDLAQTALDKVHSALPGCDAEVLELSPALITHGGPGCVVIQAVKK